MTKSPFYYDIEYFSKTYRLTNKKYRPFTRQRTNARTDGSHYRKGSRSESLQPVTPTYLLLMQIFTPAFGALYISPTSTDKIYTSNATCQIGKVNCLKDFFCTCLFAGQVYFMFTKKRVLVGWPASLMDRCRRRRHRRISVPVHRRCHPGSSAMDRNRRR